MKNEEDWIALHGHGVNYKLSVKLLSFSGLPHNVVSIYLVLLVVHRWGHSGWVPKKFQNDSTNHFMWNMTRFIDVVILELQILHKSRLERIVCKQIDVLQRRRSNLECFWNCYLRDHCDTQVNETIEYIKCDCNFCVMKDWKWLKAGPIK